MMKYRLLVLLFAAFFFLNKKGLSQNEATKSVYFMSFSHLNSSMRNELGFSFLTHFAKSPLFAEYNYVDAGISYPQPIFNRIIGVFSMTYEPQFRLVEVGSNFSVSLDLPITGSLSTVDLRTPFGTSYSTEEVTANDISTGIYAKERYAELGFFNSEFGALATMNFFQGATYENTQAMGLSLSAGINYITAPLIMNFTDGVTRSDYKGFLNWTSVVSRLGIRFGRVTMYYMIGVNPTRVLYIDRYGDDERSFGNTYNRFSIAFRLGR